MIKPRIAFFGTPKYSLLVAQQLVDAGYEIVVAITKPASAVGRKKELQNTAVYDWAKVKSIPILTPQSDAQTYWKYANEDETTQQILEFKPDLLVVANYTQKIPIALINQVKFGGLNVHPSLLPSYRGPAPIPWALLNGEKDIGVSIVTLAENFDEGAVIAQCIHRVSSTDTTLSLLDELFDRGGKLLVSSLPGFINNQKEHIDPPYQPSVCPRLSREDGLELWPTVQAAMNGVEAARLERKWRAFHPWPGLWTTTTKNGETKRLKIIKCSLSLDEKQKLILDEVQLEGKNPMSGEEFLRITS